MAINSFEFLHNDTIFGLSNSRAELETIVPECGSNTDSTARTAGTRTASSTFTTGTTIKTPTSAVSKTKFKSPYLTTDKLHMVTRRNGQTCMQRTATSIVSSFPYAADIYKASSDQFRALRNGNNKKRKPKKSVLTLPTQPAPMPQECTVSDMNESEYYLRDELEKPKPKRITQMKKKKTKTKKVQKIIDRDLKYCRQFNIDLYCSSTDSTTKPDFSELIPKSSVVVTNTPRQRNPHDVWSILRSINKFQFRPTPDSSIGSKRKRGIKKHRKDHDHAGNSVFTSCCTTEEFAYISTVDIQHDDACRKTSSSNITVIDERDQFAKLSKRATQNIREKLGLQEKAKVMQKPGIIQVNARNAKRKALLRNSLQNKKKKHILTGSNRTETGGSNIISTKTSKESMELKNNVPLGVCDNSLKTYTHFNKSQNKGMNFRYGFKNEIIKVILHKGKDCNIARKSPSPVKERKPRLCTTLTSAPYAPHLTKTEIRKQIYRLKYPIVVLGREELTSAYYVMNNEHPPQFGGLDKMSWPFMKEWYDIKENIKLEINKDVIEPKADLKIKLKSPKSKIDKVINTDNEAVYNPKREALPCSRSQQSRKSICNLKDKVLEILSKKSSMIKLNIQYLANKVGNNNYQNTAVGDSFRSTGTIANCGLEKGIQSNPAKRAICNLEVPVRNHRSPPGSPVRVKRMWCKAHGTNEFIDNVIQKVSAGVYYSQDKKKIQSFGYKEASMQTLGDEKKMTCSYKEKEKENSADRKFIYKCDPLNAIGFDEVVSGLKIECLNENQIAVKHCVTNIVIHFDVTVLPVSPKVPMESKGISCKPLYDAAGPTRAFKCDNIIINDMLPAELCAVMPKMMRDILQRISAPSMSSETLSQVNKEKTKPQIVLPMISENSIINNEIPVPHVQLSKEALDIIEGNFKTMTDCRTLKSITVDTNKFEVSRQCDLLTTPKTLWHLNAKVRAMPRIKEKILSSSYKNIMSFKDLSNATINKIKKVPYNTALQPYIGDEPRLISYDEYTLSTMAANIINFFMGQTVCNTSFYLYPLLNTILDRKLSMSIELESSKKSSILKLDKTGIVARITNKRKVKNNEPTIIVDYTNTSENKLIENKGDRIETVTTLQITNYIEPGISKPKSSDFGDIKHFKELPQTCVNCDKTEKVNTKNKKKRFIKLYRKCKSATNIMEKPTATPLAKIISLEDFFQALGPDKSLANIFDGTPGKKILECLKEMRSWITEITPIQAFLVLLLTNKKETPSLTRFRLIILQAIAVKRITRASELDMEIEVIETEKFQINANVGSHSSMPASSQNDDLLEELCWIAKTTASDYQRPFDEASETLLKSLIEKRKQLNPSYLRVMARYVGLGLLKTQNKN